MWLVYLFCALLPFQFALNLAPAIDFASGRVLALIVAGGGLASAFYYRRLHISLSLLSMSLGLFLVWAAASLIWAPVWLLGARKVFFLLTFMSLFWVIPLFTQKKSIHLEPWLVYSGALAAVIAIIQWGGQFIFGLDPILTLWRSLAPALFGQAFGEQLLAHSSWLVEVGGVTLFRAVGFFPDPHIIGFYMALLIPLALSTKKPSGWICALLCAVALLLTFSRGAYIGALVVLFVFLVTQGKHHNSKHYAVFLSVTLFMFSLSLTPIGARFLSSFNPWEGSNEERLVNWTQALVLIQEHPLQGVGLGNYAFALDPLLGERSPVYAHNLYLDIAAELGLVGLVLFIMIAASALIKSYRYGLSFFWALLWFFVQSLFDTPLFSVHVLPLFIIVLTLIDVYDPR